MIVDIDPRQDYFQHLKTLVDTRGLAPGRPEGGGGRALRHRPGLSGRLPERAPGCRWSCCTAGGTPISAGIGRSLRRSSSPRWPARIPATGAHLGLAVDADADRFGVMDAAGEYHEANEILGLLLDYLIQTRGWDGGVARSVATTHLVDRVAKLYGRPVFETKVGLQVPGPIYHSRTRPSWWARRAKASP